MNMRPESTHRLDRASSASLRNWAQPKQPAAAHMKKDVVIEMGWGRLIFAHTFTDLQRLVDTICDEQPKQRDLAFYLRDPHVVLSLAPHRLFLDPSHAYRLWSHAYRPAPHGPQGFHIRRIKTRDDAEAVNRIYASCQMVPCDTQFLLETNTSRLRTMFVAVDRSGGDVIGCAMGVDHVEAFRDPEHGASLWSLAVDPQCLHAGVGAALVRQLVEHHFARGRDYVDLSVMYDNAQAIALYERLGFTRVGVFCVKHKNPINEPLYVAPTEDHKLNPYAEIIVNEARSRGITVNVIDHEAGYFELSLGGRKIVCRESLSELTTAVAMSRCDDKRVTRRLFERSGLRVPAQRVADTSEANTQFMERHKRVVVKPARGEQGRGITVDVRTADELKTAIGAAKTYCEDVVLEQFVEGQDLRVIVIDFDVVAAAVRRPPKVVGTGEHSIRTLIEKYNRRRMAATGGESRVPLDQQTKHCVRSVGYELDETLPPGVSIGVRHTANLHTGGTIHDVTDRLHPELRRACIRAAQAIDIPVTGLDLMVPEVTGPDYVLIEANERPGLANHEPQPTAARFIDLLFPQSVQSS